ncbi:uncharacterized protein N7511_006018 [Penicillium nucicola]|uniref:uncharacterized protein n=1 Tax=Penicillium nucicola TaxID=1850975 RepID=UPI0025454AC2|nr:uncharacterized protein N7511_006018 [Penicillium nucicola]KAJ5757324.1 hypothetical protein N7511_006018 [Penicillium nucicola]
MLHLSSIVYLGLVGLTIFVSAHPGHDIKAEAAERAAFLQNAPIHARSLAQCASKLKARGHERRSVVRREMAVKHLRRRRGIDYAGSFIKARSLAEDLTISHHSNLTGIDLSSDPSILFGSGGTCILAPDVTQGPYYVSGELVREDIVESQQGVPLYMDIQLIDTNTCDPLPDIYMDLWHCNATGVYSGIVAGGNGDSSDEENINTTWLRGIQASDGDGVVHFESVFPGHYTGRTAHIHVLTHPKNETKILVNGTITGLYKTHSSYVGQTFFDQDLITAVELTAPYNTNTQSLTTNAEDGILSEEAETIDPFMEYVYLGDDISDGIFAWISVAVNPTVDRDVTPAAYNTEEGGIANPDSGMGGPGDGPGGAPPGFSGTYRDLSPAPPYYSALLAEDKDPIIPFSLIRFSRDSNVIIGHFADSGTDEEWTEVFKQWRPQWEQTEMNLRDICERQLTDPSFPIDFSIPSAPVGRMIVRQTSAPFTSWHINGRKFRFSNEENFDVHNHEKNFDEFRRSLLSLYWPNDESFEIALMDTTWLGIDIE